MRSERRHGALRDDLSCDAYADTYAYADANTDPFRMRDAFADSIKKPVTQSRSSDSGDTVELLQPLLTDPS